METERDWGRVENDLLGLLLQLNNFEQMTAALSPPGAAEFAAAIDRFRQSIGAEIERRARGEE